MSDNKINKYLEEAIENIREDRKKADSLLKDIAAYIGQSQERHREVGLTAAKYLETLQRSNEQLVKITDILKKSIKSDYGDLDDKEKNSIYDEIENPKEEE
jgi:F0F1-type ATP synthase membrane subunit b/b'